MILERSDRNIYLSKLVQGNNMLCVKMRIEDYPDGFAPGGLLSQQKYEERRDIVTRIELKR